MEKFIFFLLLLVLSCCSADRIGMFDFNDRNSSRCRKNMEYGMVWDNTTVDEYAHAVFKEDIKEKLPEKATICLTIYTDLDDCEGNGYGGRKYPTWAFVNESGRVNLSLVVEGNPYNKRENAEDLLLNIATEKVKNPDKPWPHTLGRLQLSILFYPNFPTLCH